MKAEIKAKNGTSITIEGTEEEVLRILEKIQPQEKQEKSAKQERKFKMTIGDLLLELREEKFFDKPKGLIEIKNALEEKGHVYAVNVLSTQVIRQVRRRNLGRVKKDNKWGYVKR